MTLTQTVDIPDTRWVNLNFEVPREIPTGKAQFEVKIIPFPVKKEEADTSKETQKWIDNLKVIPNKNMTAEEEKKWFQDNAEWLNKEAEDVLKDQVDIFEMGECWEDDE